MYVYCFEFSVHCIEAHALGFPSVLFFSLSLESSPAFLFFSSPDCYCLLLVKHLRLGFPCTIFSQGLPACYVVLLFMNLMSFLIALEKHVDDFLKYLRRKIVINGR